MFKASYSNTLSWNWHVTVLWLYLLNVSSLDQLALSKIKVVCKHCPTAFDVAAALVEWASYFWMSIPASCRPIFNHLATELGAMGAWGGLKLMSSCSPSVPGFLTWPVSLNYCLKQLTTSNLDSLSYWVNQMSSGPSPTFLVLVKSPMWNSTTSPLSHMLLMFSLWSSETLLAAVRASKITTFSKSSLRSNWALSGSRLSLSSTSCASQVSVYLGCGGLELNMPLSNLVMTWCCPTGWPNRGSWYADMADLYTFSVLYSNPPCLNRSVKKLAIISTGAWIGSACHHTSESTPPRGAGKLSGFHPIEIWATWRQCLPKELCLVLLATDPPSRQL